MKKISSLCAVILAAVIMISCLMIPASAVNSKVVRKPDSTTFYQGVDWMYSKAIPAHGRQARIQFVFTATALTGYMLFARSILLLLPK